MDMKYIKQSNNAGKEENECIRLPLLFEHGAVMTNPLHFQVEGEDDTE